MDVINSDLLARKLKSKEDKINGNMIFISALLLVFLILLMTIIETTYFPFKLQDTQKNLIQLIVACILTVILKQLLKIKYKTKIHFLISLLHIGILYFSFNILNYVISGIFPTESYNARIINKHVNDGRYGKSYYLNLVSQEKNISLKVKLKQELWSKYIINQELKIINKNSIFSEVIWDLEEYK